MKKFPGKLKREVLNIVGEDTNNGEEELRLEVRFYVSNEPPWGQCQGNNNFHTRTPEQI